MAPLARPAIVWLFALALPLRALTALSLDLLGPLHFHHHHHDEHHEHGPDHEHSHAHDRAERHHHPAGDPTVIAVEDGLPAAEEAASGWSATLCVTAASPRAWPDPPRLRDALAPGIEARLKTRHLERLERPPRTLLA